MKDQSFTSIEQQIKLLKSRGLKFRSEQAAAALLIKYGYYNIINGYKDNYVIKDQSDEYYKDGVTFEQIFSLFILDHNIRNTIMLIMLDVEEMLKTNAAYIIGEAFTSDYVKYSDIRNYKNIQRKNSKFSLQYVLSKFNEAYHSDRDPIKYHRDNYNNVPPWVLFKGLYLSTMVNYVRYFKAPEKEKMIHAVLAIKENSPVEPSLKKYFSDLLYLFSEYRNLCAHGGRVYNYQPSSSPIFDKDLLKNLKISKTEFNSIGRLTICLASWKDETPMLNLKRIVEKEISRHCLSFPEDKEYILTSMDIKNIPLFNIEGVVSQNDI